MREVRASSLGLLSNLKQTDSAESRAYGAAVGRQLSTVFRPALKALNVAFTLGWSCKV